MRPLRCRQPDRDFQRLECGYPLPCPHHTWAVEVATGAVTVPPDADPSRKVTERLRDVAEAVRASKRHRKKGSR